jgi:hypothetical protein
MSGIPISQIGAARVEAVTPRRRPQIRQIGAAQGLDQHLASARARTVIEARSANFGAVAGEAGYLTR